MAHATRFVVGSDGRPESCLLEQWTKIADEQGARALGDLREGVQAALQILGQGLVGHPRNVALRDALRTGKLALPDLHGQLLRVVYRLIFLFVAEDRTLGGRSFLHPVDGSEPAEIARRRYADHYSTARLRHLAAGVKGSRHGDLWHQFHVLVGALSGTPQFAAARESLALPVLGSLLWSPGSTTAINAPSLQPVDGAELANADFLEAIRRLAFSRQDKVLRPVDYKNLGSEELGGVYECLLALTPQISGDGARFTFAEFAGNERKTSGSYYTPDCLVQCLLDSALDPVVEEAIKGKSGVEAEKALLALKVCDPACGSGHFLVGAAHRMARHLSRVRAQAQGDSEPSPVLYQHALRDVIGRCLFGVDINPMSAELCRVSLWLESLEPGKPLSFLDHHIQVGNSLLGATPALMKQGIPDAAFEPIEGDDKKVCTEYKKVNRSERRGQQSLFELQETPWDQMGEFAVRMANLESEDDDSLIAIRAKEERYAQIVGSSDYLSGRFLADAWCAAFVWKKTKPSPRPQAGEGPGVRADGDTTGFDYAITEDVFRRIRSNPHDCAPWMRDEIQRLARQYQFFHWHMAFPQVFRLPAQDAEPENKQQGWSGGFDCVLGNPPWERVKLQEKEWFAQRVPEIASLSSASVRAKQIAALEQTDPQLHMQYRAAMRHAEGENMLLRDSQRFSLVRGGDINTFAVFTELSFDVIAQRGRSGLIVPSGIVTSLAYQEFFARIVEKSHLVSVFDFENRRGFFPEVHSSYRFCLLTVAGNNQNAAMLAFFMHDVEELHDSEKRFAIRNSDLALLNPNTKTCPVFYTRRDAELVRRIHERVPVLVNDTTQQNPWGIDIYRMIDANENSECLRTEEDLQTLEAEPGCNWTFSVQDRTWLRVYEGKMIDTFNHRFASSYTVEGGQRTGRSDTTSESDLHSAFYGVKSRFWVADNTVRSKMTNWTHQWLIAFMDVCSATNERTMIPAIIPFTGATKSLRIVREAKYGSEFLPGLLANWASLSFDYVVRQSVAGLHLSEHIVKQLPVLPPSTYSLLCPWSGSLRSQINHQQFLLPRVLELTYTACDLEPFACDYGYDGPPFRWDEDRRFLLRCELDAAFFHLYLPTTPDDQWKPARKVEGAVHDETPEELARLKASFPTPRDAVDYIMETFPIVKRKDEKAHGEYRTKRVILEIYDAMAEAIRTGRPYQTRLDPPPADPRVAHPPRVVVQPTATTIAIGRASAFVQVLLHHWGKPADRSTLETSLVLMLNDDVRDAVLKQKPIRDGEATIVRGMDQFLASMERSGFLQISDTGARQLIGLGPKAMSADRIRPEHMQLAAEVANAVRTIGEGRVRISLAEVADHAELELVS